MPDIAMDRSYLQVWRTAQSASLRSVIATWRRLRLITALLIFALGGGLLSACGSSGSGAASITLYNGQHQQTTDALVSGFEKATGINVKVRNGDEATLVDEVVTEGSHSPADLIYTENSPALEYLQGKGLLLAVNHSTLAQTPSQYNSPLGDWVGSSARTSVLIYNPSLISESQLPSTILQLESSAFRGKLALAPGETDFQPIVTSFVRTYGQSAAVAWLEGIKANAGDHVYPDNETVVNDVNRGLADFGVIDQYYYYRMAAEIGAGAVHSKIAFFAPQDPGYVVDVSGAGILKSSTHQAEAQRFLAYLTSRAGQEIIAHSTSFEYPIASGVATAEPEMPFDQLQPNGITIEQLGDGSTAISLIKEVGLL